MRLSVKLANETLLGIYELKEILKQEEKFTGLRITNGVAVDQSFLDIKNFDDWNAVIIKKIKYNSQDVDSEVRTDLTISENTKNEIDRLKKIFPDILGVSYVTTPYVIRLVVKASLLIRSGEF